MDDNRDAAETLHAGLVHHGYDVKCAFEPSVALEVAKDFKPAIALVDIGMPEMSGYELAVKLRTLVEGGRTLRLVAVTGYGQPSDQERAHSAGFDRHLVKPVDYPTLMKLLAESGETAVGR